jgi:replicative DNA helicase
MSITQKKIIGGYLQMKTVSEQSELISRLKIEMFDAEYHDIFNKANDFAKSLRHATCADFNLTKDEQIDFICNFSVGFDTIESALNNLSDEYRIKTIEKIKTITDFAEVQELLRITKENCDLLKIEDPENPAQTLQEMMKSQIENPIDLDNIPKTGFVEFDTIFKGFLPGQLITIGGYSASGKSTLIFSLMRRLAPTFNTLFFSLEMRSDKFLPRLIASIAGISTNDAYQLFTHKTQEKIARENNSGKLAKAFETVENMKLNYYSDVDDIARIATISRTQNKKEKIDFIFVDYVQLVRGSSFNRTEHEKIREVTRTLKLLANELGCTIIALAQIGRNAQIKDVPELSDLQGSSSIEQDSDAVILLYKDKKRNNERNLMLAKDRDFGQFGIAELRYNPITQEYI